MYTGWPTTEACQFDGRLSLIEHPLSDNRTVYRVYARSNLRFGAVVGGRNVQTTSSLQLDAGWAPWQPVRILGLSPSAVDIYFFAAQTNPIDGSSVLALFPLSQPPLACTAMTFSLDGITFSRPVNLWKSGVGIRAGDPDKQLLFDAKAHHEFRSEDHPVAGAVLGAPNSSSGRADEVLFFIHHQVAGTTLRPDAMPHVARYSMRREALQALMEEAFAELRGLAVRDTSPSAASD